MSPEDAMQVVFHEDFYQEYTSDPAAAAGRMEAIVEIIEPRVEFVRARPANEAQISLAHTKAHIDFVRESGLYDISALAAGAAIQAAEIGLKSPCFALIRPPGHHASSGSSWGFCYFNNMAIALQTLKQNQQIKTAYILDIDLHYGDGTVNILEGKDDFCVHNVESMDRHSYLTEIKKAMDHVQADLIGISAGFDNHQDDWGGLLTTEDYYTIGEMVKTASLRSDGGCFGVLEGGYNHQVLGPNVLALIQGLSGSH
jgi:acetoin utilization deacetylase AcuC-like enzyme